MQQDGDGSWSRERIPTATSSTARRDPRRRVRRTRPHPIAPFRRTGHPRLPLLRPHPFRGREHPLTPYRSGSGDGGRNAAAAAGTAGLTVDDAQARELAAAWSPAAAHTIRVAHAGAPGEGYSRQRERCDNSGRASSLSASGGGPEDGDSAENHTSNLNLLFSLR